MWGPRFDRRRHRWLAAALIAVGASACVAATSPARAPAVAPDTQPVVERAEVVIAARDDASEDGCRIAGYDPPRALDLPPAPPVPSALRASCARIERQAARLLRLTRPASWRATQREVERANAELTEEGVPEDTPAELAARMGASIGRCIGAGAGAWVVVPSRAAFEPGEDGPPRLVATVRLAFLGPDGAASYAAEREVFVGPTREDESLVVSRLEPVHDYDGDGRLELALHLSSGSATDVELFAATGAGVVQLGLPDGARVAGWVDFDADGRPDILSDGHYRQYECYEPGVSWGYPHLLIHSGVGFAFSDDDAVAIAFARGVCPCRPTRLLALDGETQGEGPLYSGLTPLRVACARLYGVSLDEIDATLARELAAEQTDDSGDVCAHSLETLMAYAEAEPPFALSPPDDRP